MQKNQNKKLERFFSPSFLFPLIHFLLTFFWERGLFRFSKDNFDFFYTTPRTSFPSATFESVLVYGLSKITAGIIILLLWKLIFALIKKRIKADVVIIFGLLYGVLLVFGLSLFPHYFGLEIDNYSNFSSVIRFLPTYWQSIYTGIFYGACMMVAPHPFSIFVFQSLAFVATAAYIFCALKKLYPASNAKWVSLFFFLLPESYFIIFNAYRNNFYTILCLFYFSYLFFAFKEKEKTRGKKELLVFASLTALIMVWRSEGLFLGLGGFIFMYALVLKKQAKLFAKKNILLLLCTATLFAVLSAGQKIGSKKYYGNDYMILNTTNVLYNIFNDPANEAKFKTKKYKPYLDAIDAVCPVQLLKESAITGYRNYNWNEGRKDFNQSLATDAEAKAYMKAYYWLIARNLETYLNVQVNMFFSSLGLGTRHKTFSYSGEKTPMEHFVYDRWGYGRKELLETKGTARWEKAKIRQKVLYPIVSGVITVWRELWTSTPLNTLFHIAALIALVFFSMQEALKLLSRFFEKNSSVKEGSVVRTGSIAFLILFLTLLFECTGIFLFMPEGRPQYMYPTLYTTYLVLFFYACDHITCAAQKLDT